MIAELIAYEGGTDTSKSFLNHESRSRYDISINYKIIFKIFIRLQPYIQQILNHDWNAKDLYLVKIASHKF